MFAASALFVYSPVSAQTCHETHFRGYADIDDIRMYYEVHGDGDPVLLLHGGTFAGAESWSRTIPAIARKYQIAPIPENMGTLLLILEDSLGKAIRPEHTQELVSAIPNATLRLIDDTDHGAPQVQSETFNTLVLEFLSGPD